MKRLLRALLFTLLIVASLLLAAQSERVVGWLQERPRPVRLDHQDGGVLKPGTRRVVSESQGRALPVSTGPELYSGGHSRSAPASNSVDG